MKDVLRLYRGLSSRTRIITALRVLLSDMERIERHTPRQGKIIDLGTGHGLFANLLALRSADRQVVGIDHDGAKIAEARRTVKGRPNITFLEGDAFALAGSEVAAFTIIDVLYLMSYDQQCDILRRCYEHLAPGGTLVWKAQNRTPRWKYYWTYFQEKLGTGIGLSRGNNTPLHFMPTGQAVVALTEAGFQVEVVPMPTKRPYSDILYLAKSRVRPPPF